MALFVRRRWPKVAAAVAVVLAIVLAVVLLTRSDSSDGDGALPPGIVETEEPVPDPTLDARPFDALLAASDADLKTYEDTAVSASSVAVQAVPGVSAAWVGPSAADRVLVVLVSPDQAFRVPVGTPVSFTGTVRRADPAFAAALGVKGADLRELRRQGVYVEIDGFEQR